MNYEVEIAASVAMRPPRNDILIIDNYFGGFVGGLGKGSGAVRVLLPVVP